MSTSELKVCNVSNNNKRLKRKGENGPDRKSKKAKNIIQAEFALLPEVERDLPENIFEEEVENEDEQLEPIENLSNSF